MTSIFPMGHRPTVIFPLPTLTADLHKVVSKDWALIETLDALRKDTVAEVRDAYTLVIKDIIWKLHQNYYKIQNQLIEQTLEWEHRAEEIPRPYSPHSPQYANLSPPTELHRQ